MRKIMVLLIMLALTSGASAQTAQKFKVNATFYRDRPPNINEVEVVESNEVSTFYSSGQNYRFRLESATGETQEFHIPLSFVGPGYAVNGSDDFERERLSREYLLPYQEAATKITIMEGATTVAISELDMETQTSTERSTSTGLIYLLVLVGIGILLFYLYSQMEVKGR